MRFFLFILLASSGLSQADDQTLLDLSPLHRVARPPSSCVFHSTSRELRNHHVLVVPISTSEPGQNLMKFLVKAVDTIVYQSVRDSIRLADVEREAARLVQPVAPAIEELLQDKDRKDPRALLYAPEVRGIPVGLFVSARKMGSYCVFYFNSLDAEDRQVRLALFRRFGDKFQILPLSRQYFTEVGKITGLKGSAKHLFTIFESITTDWEFHQKRLRRRTELLKGERLLNQLVLLHYVQATELDSELKTSVERRLLVAAGSTYFSFSDEFSSVRNLQELVAAIRDLKSDPTETRELIAALLTSTHPYRGKPFDLTKADLQIPVSFSDDTGSVLIRVEFFFRGRMTRDGEIVVDIPGMNGAEPLSMIFRLDAEPNGRLGQVTAEGLEDVAQVISDVIFRQ